MFLEHASQQAQKAVLKSMSTESGRQSTDSLIFDGPVKGILYLVVRQVGRLGHRAGYAPVPKEPFPFEL